MLFTSSKEFEEYVEYTRHLEYEKDPDYKFLKNARKITLICVYKFFL